MTVQIEGDELVIRISMENLASAAKNSDLFCLQDDEQITIDPPVFMKSVLEALKDEEEDGTTLVHEMFDNAFVFVSENGLEGMDIKGELVSNELD